jgi:7,8-dihydropterin-6-yl-methyl-4-(beta-D-ribofuranosyl)aminobenzene 5'-phosphate synthase
MRQFVVQPSHWFASLGKIPGFLKKVHTLLPEFRKQTSLAEEDNRKKFETIRPFEFPEVDSLKVEVFLEYYAKEGYIGDCGVSYRLTTDSGSVLFDLGFGTERKGVVPNMLKRQFSLSDVDGIIISHNHWDHLGGMENVRNNRILLPAELGKIPRLPCWVASPVTSRDLEIEVVDEPAVLSAGICSLGSLSRAMFWVGYCKEQVVVVNIKDKGLVLIAGCGHPSIPLMMALVKRVSDIPIYGIVGGMHLPLKESRITRDGVRLNFVMGSGMVPWKRPGKRELDETIEVMEKEGLRHLLLSAHDTCDYTLAQFAKRCTGKVEVLAAGETYEL